MEKLLQSKILLILENTQTMYKPIFNNVFQSVKDS